MNWQGLIQFMSGGITSTIICVVMFYRQQPELAIHVETPPWTDKDGKPAVYAEIRTRMYGWNNDPQVFKIWPNVKLNGGKVTGIVLDEESQKIMQAALAGERSESEVAE